MAVFPKLVVKPPKMANHPLSHYFRTSMAVGPLYPIYVRNVVSGDIINIDLQSLVNTQALLSPLYGSFKLKIMAFFAGTSLYIPKLWRNGSMQQSDGTLDAGYPTFKFDYSTTLTPAEFSVNPSSLLSYLGYGAGYIDAKGGTSSPTPQNAIPLLMYWDIFRHYFANRQETKFPYMSGITVSTDPGYLNLDLSILDDLYLSLPSNGGDITDLLPLNMAQAITTCNKPLSGLALGTYLPDRMNVILNSSFYQKNVTSVTVSTTGDSFQVDQLVTAKKLWNSRNKDAMSSGTFKDWVRMHFGVTPKIMDDMPTFLGATSTAINFEDIRATTTAKIDDKEQYLGDKSSSALGYGRSRRIVCKADRPGYLMVLAQIVPLVDYYQYTKRFTQFTKLSDEFRPEFNNIGLQDVLVSDLTTDFSGLGDEFGYIGENFSQYDAFANSVGKQPAWIEYMTEVNTVKGTFCNTENSWVLTRRMQSGANPVDTVVSSSYIHPGEWQQPFAVRAATQENFLVQFYINARARSTVLKRLMPKF